MASTAGRTRVLALDTHPIQYRGPLFAALATDPRIDLTVAYFCREADLSHHDSEFATVNRISHEILVGYRHLFMGSGRLGDPPQFFRFRGGAWRVLSDERPDVVVLNSLGSLLCWQFLFAARLRSIPVWLRVETQDEARLRSTARSLARALVYRLGYQLFAGAFAIGRLNRAHLLRHGFRAAQIVATPYATVDRVKPLGSGEVQQRRRRLRDRLGIDTRTRVVGFFGKLIEKKNPLLLVDAIAIAQRPSEAPLSLLIVGHGPLAAEVEARCSAAGIRVHFAGFVPQCDIVDYYLATDIAVLPSRRAGETWGLVVNEALQAGCAVAVTDAVGCAVEFSGLPRFEVVPEDDPKALADAIVGLSTLERAFGWCGDVLDTYSVAYAAQQMANALGRPGRSGRSTAAPVLEDAAR
jgi:glycosyltransferase involved in cell wall biosynthesis